MKTKVLYHNVPREGKEKFRDYVSARDIGLMALIFAIGISAHFLAACI